MPKEAKTVAASQEKITMTMAVTGKGTRATKVLRMTAMAMQTLTRTSYHSRTDV
jgi:hypothetical protein